MKKFFTTTFGKIVLSIPCIGTGSFSLLQVMKLEISSLWANGLLAILLVTLGFSLYSVCIIIWKDLGAWFDFFEIQRNSLSEKFEEYYTN